MNYQRAKQMLDDLSHGASSLHVLVLAAHPDDDIIGVGGSLDRPARVDVVFLTDGALGAWSHGQSPADYKATRRLEARSALRSTGANLGTLTLFDFRDGALSQDLIPATRQVSSLLWQLRPDVVITHAFEGGHPDHDATRFIAGAALDTVRRQNFAAASPELLEMTGYHSPSSGGGMEVGTFLVGDKGTLMGLGRQELQRRRSALNEHASQKGILGNFQVLTDERLRVAEPGLPDTPLIRPVYYETHAPWGAHWIAVEERDRMIAAEDVLFARSVPRTRAYWNGPRSLR